MLAVAFALQKYNVDYLTSWLWIIMAVPPCANFNNCRSRQFGCLPPTATYLFTSYSRLHFSARTLYHHQTVRLYEV